MLLRIMYCFYFCANIDFFGNNSKKIAKFMELNPRFLVINLRVVRL